MDGSFDETCVASVCAASGVSTSAAAAVGGATPAAVAANIAGVLGVPPSGEVLLVRTGDVRGSLAAAAISASRGVPLLLTADTTLGPDARAWIASAGRAVRRSVTAGTAGAMSATALAGAPGVVRVSGTSVSLAAARLNARYYPAGSTRSLRPVAVSGGSAAQYLAAATYAARRGQPVVPFSGSALPDHSREWITNRRTAISGFTVVSGGSVPYLMDWELAKADAP